MAYIPGNPEQKGNVWSRQNLPPQRAWRAVTLQPGKTASFDFAGGDYNNVAARSCPTTAAVGVSVPNTDTTVLVKVRVPACGPFDITPIVAGSNDLQGPGEEVPMPTPTTTVAEPPAGLPAVLRAKRLAPSVRSQYGPRYLAPGSSVRAASVGARVRATPQVSYGLVNLGGSQWPVISTDGGQQWRVDGPLFSYAGAQGASTTSVIATLSPNVAYAWGHGGNFVKITYDAGADWWLTDFPAGVYSVTKHNGTLQTRALGSQTPGGQFETFLYISTNQGRTWERRARPGNVPY